MATYPDNILVKGNVVNEVDVVDEGDHNILKNEIIALQTYIGTSPQGQRDSLTTRINASLSGSGGFIITASDPVETYPGKFWYNSTALTLKTVKPDYSIEAIGGSFSNNLFSFSLAGLESTAAGISFGSTVTGQNNVYAMAWTSKSSSFQTAITSKLRKITGVSTALVYAKIWQDIAEAANQAAVRVSIGTVVGSAAGSVNQVTPEWVNFSMDLTGLANGTVYDLIVELRQISASQAYMNSIIGFGL